MQWLYLIYECHVKVYIIHVGPAFSQIISLGNSNLPHFIVWIKNLKGKDEDCKLSQRNEFVSATSFTIYVYPISKLGINTIGFTNVCSLSVSTQQFATLAIQMKSLIDLICIINIQYAKNKVSRLSNCISHYPRVFAGKKGKFCSALITQISRTRQQFEYYNILIIDTFQVDVYMLDTKYDNGQFLLLLFLIEA